MQLADRDDVCAHQQTVPLGDTLAELEQAGPVDGVPCEDEDLWPVVLDVQGRPGQLQQVGQGRAVRVRLQFFFVFFCI